MDYLLEYGNVVLRALEPDDIDLLYLWENDTALWEVSNSKTPFSRQLLTRYLQEATRDIYEQKQFRFIIQDIHLQPKGTIDLFDFDPYHQRAGVGIMIYKKTDRRLGYASDSLAALENYCLHSLGIRQLYANISERNDASLQLFQKSGYQVTGIKKQWLKTGTGWCDEWIMQKFLT